MENFETNKQILLIKIEALKKEFDDFTKQVSPDHWRTCGTLYTNLNKMEHDVKKLTEISKKHLEIDWVRKELKLDE